jgi:hypothetical protein
MKDENRLNRLMTGLIRGAPPQPDRLGAVLGKAVAIRRRRRAVAATGTAVLAVIAVTTGVLVSGSGRTGAQDNLFADDPTPTEAGEPTPTASATASPRPTAQNTADPRATGPASGRPSVVVQAASLLSTDYVEKAFGADRTAHVATTTEPFPGLIRSCYHLPGDEPRSFVARSWSWPGEVVVSEAIAREHSSEAAQERYRTCSDPTARGFDPDTAGYEGGESSPVSHEVDLGKEGTGTVVVVPRPLDTSVYASAVLDDVVVVLTWRQTGTIGSRDALVQALVSAVAKATTGAEGTTSVAPAQQVPDALQGFLGTSDLPYRLPWVHDAQGPVGLPCGHTQVPTAAPLVSRLWSATGNGAPEPTTGVTISVTRAADGTTAASGFAACKQAWAETNHVNDPMGEGVGDESFWFSPDALSIEFVVRSGPTYLVVQYETGSYDDTIALARTALDSLQSAGRLS